MIRNLQERALRLGHRAAAACLYLAQQTLAVALSVVDRIGPTVIAALERWDTGPGPRWLEAGYDFTQRWRRILVGVLIGILLSTASFWAWSTWRAWQLGELASVTRTWPEARILGDVTVEVTTRCTNATLSYIVAIIPPKGSVAMSLRERTDQGKVVTDEIRNRLKSVRLQFTDRAGEPLADHELPMDDFVRIYSSVDERPLILEARGMTKCDAARYVREDALSLAGVERPQPGEPGTAER